jgi:hypothetical protein
VWFGKARHGKARLSNSSLKQGVLEMNYLVGYVEARQGPVWRGMVRQGQAWCGMARFGMVF